MTRVGQVTAAYGIDGAVKVLPLTDFDDRFHKGSTLVLDGSERVVEWSRNAGDGLVVKLRGIENRTMAELCRGRYLEIPEGAVRPAGEGKFYHHELIGLPVSTAAGSRMGVIEEVLERPANDVWVSRDGTVEYLIPATKDAVVDVDLAAKQVIVADWLLQTEDA